MINADVIKVSLASNPFIASSSITVSLKKTVLTTAATPATLSLELSNPFVFSGTITGTTTKTDHYVLVQFGAGNNIVDYQIKIEINGAIVYFGNGLGSSDIGSLVNKISINNACKFNIKYDLSSSSAINTDIQIFYPNKTAFAAATTGIKTF